HYGRLAAPQREVTRVLSLVHLHNNPEVSDEVLRQYRSALDDLVGALSGRDPTVAARYLDEQKALLAIDLIDLGWVAPLWEEILPSYRYAPLRAVTRSQVQQTLAWARTALHFLRADWLLSFLSTPPARARFLQKVGGHVPASVVVAGRRFHETPL